jgi:hypothetical protein
VLSSRTAGKGRQGVGVPVVLVAGEGPDEDLGTWRRAAATAGRPPSRRQEEETEGGREGGSAHTGRGREKERPACTAHRLQARPGWVHDSSSAWRVEQNWALSVRDSIGTSIWLQDLEHLQ